jgi:DNA-binding IclR family transcriptional regulator
MTTGAMLPLANSGTGFALLSGYSKEYICRIVSRSNAEHLHSAEPFNVVHIHQRVDLVRSQGFAYEEGLVNPDRAVLSFPLSIIEGNAPLVLTIGAQKRNMPGRLPELLRVTREVLNAFDASLLPISDSLARAASI